MKTVLRYDVAVIGSGPAGIMAAIFAAKTGARVALIERNSEIGKKILLTGGGRCNITHKIDSLTNLCDKYGKEGRFLMNAFCQFSPKEVMEFFEKHGVPLIIEDDGRVFPASNKASDVVTCLQRALQGAGVNVFYNTQAHIGKVTPTVVEIYLKRYRVIRATACVVCTGGKAYPLTGSTGDGYEWAKDLGHNIIQLRPALCPVELNDEFVKDVQGVGLKNVSVQVIQKGKKYFSKKGDILFTHFGISGPAILDASTIIGDLLTKGEVGINLNIVPDKSATEVDEILQDNFRYFQNKHARYALDLFVPQRLGEILVINVGINPNALISEIGRAHRYLLAQELQKIELSVKGLLGYDVALITSGGISLKELEVLTMQSKKNPHFFFAGEIINLHGPTGGYNLQLCWSTGRIAGIGAANYALGKK